MVLENHLMTADQVEALLNVAIATLMLFLGLGVVKLPANPNLRLLNPTGVFFRRLMLIGSICLLLVAFNAFFRAR